MTQGKCPDCPKARQGSHQILYDCNDGKMRCMACRAKFEKDGKVETLERPPYRRRSPLTDEQFTATLSEAMEKGTTMGALCKQMKTSDSTLRKRARKLGIDWPGKDGKRGPESTKEPVAPEPDADSVTVTPQPELPYKVTTHVTRKVEVTGSHGGVDIVVREAQDGYLVVALDGDPEQEYCHGAWVAIAHMILAYDDKVRLR